jgi:hypothetical protein
MEKDFGRSRPWDLPAGSVDDVPNAPWRHAVKVGIGEQCDRTDALGHLASCLTVLARRFSHFFQEACDPEG